MKELYKREFALLEDARKMFEEPTPSFLLSSLIRLFSQDTLLLSNSLVFLQESSQGQTEGSR
ncbi:MAG: hypothetical protein D3906_04240 [Candidatus Electrothrix sp. AUS1_2]|nr:hypothetical protein [Candidatus Electrothrix sp. AUS1_2]